MMALRCSSSSGTLIRLAKLQSISPRVSNARCRVMSSTPTFMESRRFSLSAGYPTFVIKQSTVIRYKPWMRQNNQYSSSKPRTSSSGNGKSSSTSSNVVSESASSESPTMTMWQRFLGPKPMPERHTFAWYREILLICTVFAITGSSTMLIVRPAVSNGLGIKGSFWDGPWSYRICSIVIMTPIYATLLVGVGTLFGRHHYFRHFSVKIFSRFGIPPEMIDATYHETKHTFRKW